VPMYGIEHQLNVLKKVFHKMVLEGEYVNNLF